MTASPPPVLPDDRLASGIARVALHYRGRFSAETIQRLAIDSYERIAVVRGIRDEIDAHITELLASLPST